MSTDTVRSTTDSEQQIQLILNAATSHNNQKLQEYLNSYFFSDCEAVDVLDAATNRCPLHCAIAGCGSNHSNGESAYKGSNEDIEQAGSTTVSLLLENGAIWNQLDNNDETPGCLARRLGLSYLYQLMVDAGVRAEIILNRLEGYEQINDSEDDNGIETEPKEEGFEVEAADGDDAAIAEIDNEVIPSLVVTDVNSSDYLSSTLSFTKDKLLDDQSNGVMMEWERSIMELSAKSIVDQSDMKILNIGAGMLIFDTIVQALPNRPESHHIIEAHPDVLADMKSKGWDQKDGVVIHEGRWQDILPELLAQDETYDAIYFDTFAESYSQFRDFFQEHVIGLLRPDGKWSYFNGMGADRQISYDVYQKVVEMDLLESGFDVEWQEIDIPTLDREWEGVKRKYWNIDTYRLPVCKFMT